MLPEGGVIHPLPIDFSSSQSIPVTERCNHTNRWTTEARNDEPRTPDFQHEHSWVTIIRSR